MVSSVGDFQTIVRRIYFFVSINSYGLARMFHLGARFIDRESPQEAMRGSFKGEARGNGFLEEIGGRG